MHSLHRLEACVTGSWNGEPIKVQPLALVSQLDSLTQTVQVIAALLSDLQQNVNDGVHGKRRSDTFARIRHYQKTLHGLCEEYITFLQRCSGYAEDRTYLAQAVSTHETFDCLQYAQNIINVLTTVIDNAGSLQHRQRLLLSNLQNKGSGLPHWSEEMERIIFFVLCLPVQTHDNTCSNEPKALALVDARVDALRSYPTEFAALLERERDSLMTIASLSDDAFTSEKESIVLSFEKWKFYNDRIKKTISDISATSDAFHAGANLSLPGKTRPRLAYIGPLVISGLAESKETCLVAAMRLQGRLSRITSTKRGRFGGSYTVFVSFHR